MNVLAPFGFFGAGNIGDESTLQGFAHLVSQYQRHLRVWIASRNPSHTSRVEPSFNYYHSRGRNLRRRWARFRSTAQVIVGGTPIMDILGKWPLSELTPIISAAHSQQQPVVFIGSGIERLQREESRRLFNEKLAPVVRYWTVRSERDKRRLLEYGVKAERVSVAADLAWTLDARGDEYGRGLLTKLGVDVNRYLVGVNLRNEAFVNHKEPRLFEKTAEFLDGIIEKQNAKILFFANEVREGESFDKAASQKAIACMKHKDQAVMIPNEYRTPQQTLSLVSCCQLTVSMRYHFCLFSALQSVPFIALKRSDKVDDLCWDMDWTYGITMDNFTPTELMDRFSALEENRKSVIAHLRNQVQSMRTRALTNHLALDVD